MQLAVVDVVDVAGPPTHAVAAVESWAQTLASPATRRSYRSAVRALLAEHGEITPAALAAWRDEMAACDLARATIRQRIAAVRAFAAWAARTGALPAELAAGLAAVKAPKLAGQHAPLALDEAQLRLMDRAAGAPWPDDPLRVAQARAVLRVLGGSGLRVSELAGAQLADLVAARPSVADRAALQGRDVDGWSLHVRGKGGRRRTCPRRERPGRGADRGAARRRRGPRPRRPRRALAGAEGGERGARGAGLRCEELAGLERRDFPPARKGPSCARWTSATARAIASGASGSARRRRARSCAGTANAPARSAPQPTTRRCSSPSASAGAMAATRASGAAAANRYSATCSSAWAPPRSSRRRCATRHALRHTCATELLRAGATIADVRVFLGHASVKTTSIYLASGDERQAEIVRLRARQRPTLDDDRDAAS